MHDPLSNTLSDRAFTIDRDFQLDVRPQKLKCPKAVAITHKSMNNETITKEIHTEMRHMSQDKSELLPESISFDLRFL
jgi:hypothetical protein